MKNIVLYSPYDCLVKIGEKELLLNENEHAVIDNNQQIYIYPTGKTKRYSFIVDINDNNSRFYSIVEKDDKILVFLIDGLLTQNIDIYSFRHNGLESSIEVSSQVVTFKTKQHKKKIFLYSIPTSIKCGNFYHIDYCLLEFDKDKDVLIAYNTKNNNARQFSGDKIELKDNGFKVYVSKNIYDKLEEEYKIDSGGLKLKDKSFVLANNKFPSELLPYQFMCAVKNGDTNLMKELLSSDILNKLDVENIKEYFGNIEYFYMIDYKTCFALSNKQNVIYEFYLKDNKICEINDNKKE